MTNPVNPHSLLSELEAQRFYGQVEFQFRHGRVTYIKKTESFVTEDYGPNHSRKEQVLKNSDHPKSR